MHCQVFDIRQKVLSPEHPDTLMSMSNLASGCRITRASTMRPWGFANELDHLTAVVFEALLVNEERIEVPTQTPA